MVIQSLLSLYTCFKTFLFWLCEKCLWSFDRHYIEYVDCLGQYTHFTILILPVQEHGIYILSVYINFSFFHQHLIVCREQVFCILAGFILRYFILLDAMVNGISPLISLSDFSLLVFRNAKGFCVSILYLETTKFIDEL